MGYNSLCNWGWVLLFEELLPKAIIVRYAELLPSVIIVLFEELLPSAIIIFPSII